MIFLSLFDFPNSEQIFLDFKIIQDYFTHISWSFKITTDVNTVKVEISPTVIDKVRAARVDSGRVVTGLQGRTRVG